LYILENLILFYFYKKKKYMYEKHMLQNKC
jgi:hypothetical protein